MTPVFAQFFEFFQHHIPLFAALAAALVAFIANELHGQFSGPTRVSPLEAVRMINDRDALVVDVRAAADFKKGHLMNAISVPAAKLNEQTSQLGKDKGRPILVYCALGGASSEAARKLLALGYSDVHPIRGGLENWLSANLPTTVK